MIQQVVLGVAFLVALSFMLRKIAQPAINGYHSTRNLNKKNGHRNNRKKH